MAATFTSCTCPARWSARWSAIIIPFVTGLKLPDITFVEADREAEHSRRENTDNRFFTNSFIISFAPWSLLQVESNRTMVLNDHRLDCGLCNVWEATDSRCSSSSTLGPIPVGDQPTPD